MTILTVLQGAAAASPQSQNTTASYASQCMMANGVADLLQVAAVQGELAAGGVCTSLPGNELVVWDKVIVWQAIESSQLLALYTKQ